MPELYEMLRISPAKVAQIIGCAKEAGMEAESCSSEICMDEPLEPQIEDAAGTCLELESAADTEPAASAKPVPLGDSEPVGAVELLEEHPLLAGEEAGEEASGGTARSGLHNLMDELDEDELASLIALTWIGRGTYAPGEIGEAISAAKAGYRSNASAYLFSLPLLPDYLEDGLDLLAHAGISTEAELYVTVEDCTPADEFVAIS